MKTQWWTSSSGEIELKININHAKSCSHSGKCDDDVEMLSTRLYIKEQLKDIPTEKMAKVLTEYGAWDTNELKDREQNIQRLLWIASCDLSEGMFDENERSQ